MNAKQKLFSSINLAIKRKLTLQTIEFSKLALMLLISFRDAGFINNFYMQEHTINNHRKKYLTILYKYIDKRPILKQILPISSGGRRVSSRVNILSLISDRVNTTATYRKPKAFSYVTVFFHTTKGILTIEQMQRHNIGGTALCVAYV